MDAKFEKLKLDNVKHIIAVASGKGGVGKSTVASNLSVAFARNGYKTALVDADIFGPSIPRMFGIENAQPEVSAFGDKQIFFPMKKFGVEIISIGFFIDKSASNLEGTSCRKSAYPAFWRYSMERY